MAPYHPTSTITDGSMELEGVRLLSSTSPTDPRFVYLSIEKEPAGGPEGYRVLATHNNDVIQLSTTSLEDVFNRIAEAIDYYRDIDYQVALALQSEDPLQRFVDVCQEHIGPTYIMDQRYHLLAISHMDADVLGPFASTWKLFEDNRFVPLDSFYERMDNTFYQRINDKVRNLVFENELTVPYVYGVMNTYCDEEGNIIGQCMTSFDHPVGKADLQLIDACLAQLRAFDLPSQAHMGSYHSELVLSTLAHGEPVLPEDMVKMHMQQTTR